MENLVYVNILTDVLRRKYNTLKEILKLTEEQRELLKDSEFSVELFKKMMSKKTRLIRNLKDLDSGFETIYRKVKAELEDNSQRFKSEIAEMQRKVMDITGLSTEIQALEERNKVQFELRVANRKSSIRQKAMNNKGVSSYYRNMTSVFNSQARYVDKRK